MKHLFLTSILSIFSYVLSAQDTYFLNDPTLSPDGQTIIFSYDGDLWKVKSIGGEASRLTGMQGDETLPSISPDGQWIAFSGTQYGNKDIYIMPMGGGEIKQLTHHDAVDDVDSWSWDSKTIYFTSSRTNRFGGYHVNINGSTPVRMFNHYFNKAHNIAVHPKTDEIFFNESWESKTFTNRKRYKGEYNPNIKSYNPKTKQYKEYTTYNGKDLWATIDKNGSIYFASDENTNEYNLYTFKNNTKTALTNFKTSIGRPHVSANGQKVVFTKDYQIHLYDVAASKTQKVNISLFKNNTLSKPQDFKVTNNITYFDVSPDNKKMAFVSRGELFVSDTKGKFVKQLNTAKDQRVLEVKWLKDNRTLLFNQTVGGYHNLFTIVADGTSKEKQQTKDAKNNVNLELDHKLEKAVYVSGRDELRLLDLNSFKSTTIVTDEFWALRPTTAKFSPDDTYLVYNAFRNFERDVFVYHIPSKKTTNLSNTGVNEADPVWSADGKYIYFDSNLTRPSFPRGNNEVHIYQMALDQYEAPFTSDKFDSLFTKKVNEKDDKKEDTKAPINISINENELMQRLTRISPNFGLQGNTQIVTKGDISHIYYTSNHDKGNFNLWQTTIKPFESNKTEKVGTQNVRGYLIKSVKDKDYILFGGNIHILNVSQNKTSKINIDATFRKNLNNEFNQMFYEAWAGFESNFYDGNFHGQNWQGLRDRYGKFLPYITKRSELRLLFNDMLGELNTSHFGFRSTGDEEDEYYGSRTLETGIVFSKNNPYAVERIISKSPSDVKGKDIKKGDVLISVNGKTINTELNREAYFSEPSLDNEVQLVFKRSNKNITINIHPTSSANLRTLLYDEWVDDNQTYTDNKSDNKIAYVHMKNMSGGELTNFEREMVSETYNKDALILDLRNNTGGNVHDDVLQFLSQKPYSNWKYRDGKSSPQPNFGPAGKPIIILINEQTLSDGEVTTAGFKELGLGKVIGTETYRWIIFTSGAGLVDGSFYRLPSWGCYTLSGDNLEATGVKPDIYVKENFEDRLKGNQPQLDKAIEEILKSLKN